MIVALPILILCITGSVVSCRNWNARCRKARAEFLDKHTSCTVY